MFEQVRFNKTNFDLLESLPQISISFRNLWTTWEAWLKPFFEVDGVLPYTFLALLNENQLIALLKTTDKAMVSTLPLFGVLASVEYSIQFNKKDDKVRVDGYLKTK